VSPPGKSATSHPHQQPRPAAAPGNLGAHLAARHSFDLNIETGTGSQFFDPPTIWRRFQMTARLADKVADTEIRAARRRRDSSAR